MGSQADGSTHSPMSHWVAVWTMIAGTAAMGAAIILAWAWLGIVGGVLLVGGAGYALASGIMSSTEDYPMGHRDAT